MSLGVQLIADIKPQGGPAQSAEASNLEGSDEFSNMMEDASAECRGECSGDSERSDNFADTNENGKEDRQSGNDLPASDAAPADQEVEESPGKRSVAASNTEESAVPLNMIEQIYDAGTDVEAVTKEPVTNDTSEVKDTSKTQLPMNGLFIQTQAESEQAIPVEELPATSIDEQQPVAFSNPVEAERRRVGLGTVKEGASTAFGLRGADSAQVGITQVDNSLAEQTDLAPNALRQDPNLLQQRSGEGIDFKTSGFERGMQNVSEMVANQDMPRKADLEAMLKELASAVPKDTNGSSLLSGSGAQSLTAFGLGGSVGSLQAATAGPQSAALSGSNQLLSLSTAVTDQGWADDFSVRIRTLVSGNVQQATLNLKPADLGAIEVSLSTEGNETKAQFSVQNGVVKEVLEASMPRLREIFEESGLSLTDTDVRDQSLSQHANDQNTGDDHKANTADLGNSFTGNEETELSDPALVRWDGDQLRGGIDTYT